MTGALIGAAMILAMWCVVPITNLALRTSRCKENDVPRDVPYKDFPGVPGVKVATYSTPTCDEHIDAERAGNGCPYCVLAGLVEWGRGLMPFQRDPDSIVGRLVADAKAVLSKRRRYIRANKE